MKKVFGFLFFVFIFSPDFCVAQVGNMGDVVVNEMAWMGGVNSANDEWVELKNMTGGDIDLSGWSLKSADGKLKITLKGFIVAGGYFLMERTDDNSVPNIPADMLYTGALSNAGQYLKLYDSLSNPIDQVDFSAQWPAGNNTTKQTMEKGVNDWQTSANAGGTPKAENSQGANPNDQTPMTLPTGQAGNQIPLTRGASPQVHSNDQKTETVNPTSAVETPTATYPDGVIINEILPAPEGDDATNEWVEIYNSAAAAVDISGWKLQDTQGTPATYIFPAGTTIAAEGYLVLTRPETKITLNNDQDGLQLLFPNGKVAGAVLFAGALVGQSYNNTTSDWRWSTAPTPGAANIASKPLVKVSAAQKTTLPTVKKPDNKAYVAALSEASASENIPTNNTSNPWPLFLVAMGVIVISAIIILLAKFKNLNIEKLFKN